MAFDPSKTAYDNFANIAGTDWYHKTAKTMGGNSSDPWNTAIQDLDREFSGTQENGYKGFDKNDSAQVQAWTDKVRKLTGTAAPVTTSSSGQAGQGGITGGGSMATANQSDVFKTPTNLPAGFADVAAGSQYQASTGTFDESKGVAGRVNQITSAGGPLMTAARTRAKQAAARGGLLNTSLAGQAGEQAVIDSAAPIAGADAQLYQSQQLANQNSLNAAAQSNAQLRTSVGLQGLTQGESARQFDAGLGWDKEKTNSNLVEQRRQFDASNGLEGYRLSQQDRQFQQDLGLQRENLAAQREQFAQKLGLDAAQLQLSRDQLSQQDKQFLADLDAKDKQLAQQESQFTRDQSSRITLANMDAASREKLVALESSYKKDIAGNENISRAWGTMMESIDRIQNNPDLDASTKATMIANTQAGFQGFTNFWKKVGGGTTDVSDLLNFGPATNYGGGGGGQPAVNSDPSNRWDQYNDSTGQ